MKNTYVVLASLAALAAIIYAASSRRRSSSAQLAPINVTALPMTSPPPTPWLPPAAAGPYLPTIYATEHRYGIPHNLLARLLDQESSFRPEVISGAVRSSAGAVGIAQLLPQYFPGVDATNWIQSIDAAGKYLAQLHTEFGAWSLALAAYDWGPGNVQDWIASGADTAAMPTETQNYVGSITRDVAVA